VALTGEGFRLTNPAVSPDGRTVLCRDAQGRHVLRSLVGDEARPLPEVGPGAEPVRFSADGRALFLLVATDLRHARVTRFELETGVQSPLHDLDTETDRVSVFPSFTADGRAFAYSVWKGERSLFVVTGLGR
jgi:hypothetical protein